jgi:hypothetical protein
MSEVRIHHPRWNRTLSVPTELWPGRLAAKGWQLAEGTVVDQGAELTQGEAVADQAAEVPPELTKGSFVEYQAKALGEKEHLQQVLRDRGVSFHHRLGVAKLRKLVEDTE